MTQQNPQNQVLARGLAAAGKISAANTEVATRFIKRDEIALAFWLALIADRASFLLGPPGVGKTATTQYLASLVSGLSFYEELMPTVVSPEQLLVSETEILETPTASGGKAIRVVNKMGNAAKAHLVFLDEIWKTQLAVAKVLFDLLMANGVRLGGQFLETPTLGVITASNELPEPGNQLEALWSRMAFRFLIKPLDRAGKIAMMKSRLAQGVASGHVHHGSTPPATQAVMTLADVEALQTARPLVQLPDDIIEIVMKIAYEDLYGKDAAGFGWLVSDDRRFDVIREGLQAHALMHGRATVAKADLAVLRYMLWDTPEQIPMVEAVVAPYCRTAIGEARSLIDDLLVVDGSLHKFGHGDTRAVKALEQVKQAKTELSNLLQGAGSDSALIQSWINQLTVLSAKVSQGAFDSSNRMPWSEIQALFQER